MSQAKITTMVVIFEPRQRRDLENDLAIAHSITSRMGGAFHPASRSAVSEFADVGHCIQAAAALADWLARTEEGLLGVGIGIDGDGRTEAASRLAEHGLAGGGETVFLTEAVHTKVRQVPGLEFRKIDNANAAQSGNAVSIYALAAQRQGLAAIEDAKQAGDTSGWDAEPIVEEEDDGADATVMALTDMAEEPAAQPAAQPAAEPDDATLMNMDPVATEPPAPTLSPTPPAQADTADDDATLVNVPLPVGRAAVSPGDVADLRAALDAMTQCEAAARRCLELGEPYLAACEIDRVLSNDAIQGLSGLEGPLETLGALREEIFANAWVTAGLQIQGEAGDIYLYHGDSLMIGRDPGDGAVGMKLGCRTISRIPKQLRIDRRGGNLTVTDLGSANGSFLDDQPLTANQPTPLDRLDKGMTLSLGGVLQPPEKGDCRLSLTLFGGSMDLLIQVATGHFTETSQAQLRANWPGMDRDCASRWVFAQGGVTIGAGDQHAVPLSSAPGQAAVARIERTAAGYVLAPGGGEVSLDGAQVLRPVAIIDGAKLNACGHGFQFRDVGG